MSIWGRAIRGVQAHQQAQERAAAPQFNQTLSTPPPGGPQMSAPPMGQPMRGAPMSFGGQQTQRQYVPNQFASQRPPMASSQMPPPQSSFGMNARPGTGRMGQMTPELQMRISQMMRGMFGG